MISRTSAERVLNAALATGGDFAELYMEDGESHSISMPVSYTHLTLPTNSRV